jgi:hypothetical protein
VDEQLAPRLERLSDRKVEAETKKLAQRLDQPAYVDHLSRVEAERCVSLRPAPDCMTWFSALLPVKTGVATYAALVRAANTARAAGDGRTRGQVMADALFQRVTGLASADDVPLAIDMVITDPALFNLGEHPDRNEPAVLLSAGVPPVVIPAELARRAVTDASGDADIFIRRLYTSPESGELVAMDSASRCFTGNLRRFLVLRDQTCRTPWCDAPIRQVDHVTRAADGGPTTADQGQGLCEACNYAKEAPGWTQTLAVRESQHPRDAVITTTPTGHTYASTPPAPPGTRTSGAAPPRPDP